MNVKAAFPLVNILYEVARSKKKTVFLWCNRDNNFIIINVSILKKSELNSVTFIHTNTFSK